jgi:hypothetical protein
LHIAAAAGDQDDDALHAVILRPKDSCSPASLPALPLRCKAAMLRQRQSCMQIMNPIDPSARIALAPLLHDIGKPAEGAALLDYRAVRALLAYWKETW